MLVRYCWWQSRRGKSEIKTRKNNYRWLIAVIHKMNRVKRKTSDKMVITRPFLRLLFFHFIFLTARRSISFFIWSIATESVQAEIHKSSPPFMTSQNHRSSLSLQHSSKNHKWAIRIIWSWTIFFLSAVLFHLLYFTFIFSSHFGFWHASYVFWIRKT